MDYVNYEKGEFRPGGNIDEFYDKLESLKLKQSQLLFWQTTSSGERKTVGCVISSYSTNNTKTSINLKGLEVENFQKQLPVFIYEDESGILFKGKYESFADDNLQVIAEEKVFFKEQRDTYRVKFHYTNVYVDLKFGQKLDFHKIKLKDITEMGFGVIVDQNMAIAFKEGMELNITKLNEVEMPIPLEGLIAHKTPTSKIKGHKKGSVLLGVKFSKPNKLLKDAITALQALNKSS